MSPKHIRGFDGLRAFAVMPVVLTHSGLTDAVLGTTGPFAATFAGSNGVIIFFALSGFLITDLLLRERRATGVISFSKFYIRRALRIFPLYYLVLSLSALEKLLVYAPLLTNKSFLFAAIYMMNFIPRDWYSAILGHTWSLAVEEHFYLAWPAILCFLGFCIPRGVTLLSVAIIGSTLLLNLLLMDGWLNSHFFLERWTPIAGAAIAFGCLFALLLSQWQFQELASNIFSSRLAAIAGIALFAHSFLIANPPLNLENYLRATGAALMIAWVYLNQESRTVGLHPVPKTPS